MFIGFDISSSYNLILLNNFVCSFDSTNTSTARFCFLSRHVTNSNCYKFKNIKTKQITNQRNAPASPQYSSEIPNGVKGREVAPNPEVTPPLLTALFGWIWSQ